MTVRKGYMENKLQRWRTPYIKHLAKLSLHTERFIMAKGNCTHFTHMTPELMQKTMRLKSQLDDYVNEYRQRIVTSGALKNLERFID